MNIKDCDLGIIGGGIVGLATAYSYQKKHPDKIVYLLEKEKEVACHQSSHNSGVIHSGLYYKPGSKKAQLCVTGREMLIDFAKKHNVPFEICGKIILASDASEIPSLEKIYANGLANGLEGLQILDQSGIREKEPFCQGVKGLWVPSTGIIDYKIISEKLAEEFLKINPQSKIFFDCKAENIKEVNNLCAVKTKEKIFQCQQIICCAGLYADNFSQQKKEVRVIPFRGDYYELTNLGKHKVKNLIYPVPNPKFPFLGVHFTRMLDGNVECGPNAVFSFKREGYSKLSFSIKDSFSALVFPGLWKFAKKNWRYAITEYSRALSKRKFLSSLQKMIPSMKMEDIETARSGVRAQAMNVSGELIYDFLIERQGNQYNVLNAPSPAATASLAIGQYIVDFIDQKKNKY